MDREKSSSVDLGQASLLLSLFFFEACSPDESDLLFFFRPLPLSFFSFSHSLFSLFLPLSFSLFCLFRPCQHSRRSSSAFFFLLSRCRRNLPRLFSSFEVILFLLFLFSLFFFSHRVRLPSLPNVSPGVIIVYCQWSSGVHTPQIIFCPYHSPSWRTSFCSSSSSSLARALRLSLVSLQSSLVFIFFFSSVC